jgi:hypothetical protein
MLASGLLGLYGLALVTPSANYQVFDGLPLGTVPEYLFAVGPLPLFFHRGLRSTFARWLRRRRLLAAGLWTSAGLALLLKVGLFASGDYTGLQACYGSPLSPAPAGRCELSYENPLSRFGATRLDERIDFTPDTWRLSFLNSARFNIYPWVPGNRLRDRLPITATWLGWLRAPDSRLATILYVGEGRVQIGTRTIVLEPTYGRVERSVLQVPTGLHQVLVDYRFDDSSRVGEPVKGPYARLQLQFQDPGGAPAEVEFARPGRWSGGFLAMARIADLLIAGVGAVLIGFCVSLLARDWWWFAGIAGAWLLTPALAESAALLVHSTKTMVAGGLVLLGVLTGVHVRRLVGAFYAWVTLAMVLLWPFYGSSGAVLLRTAGDDWLTYESFARSILEGSSLEGGEAVFYYQPLFRYIRFVEHVLLGDGDLCVAVSALAALGLSIVWMMRRFHRPRSRLSTAVCFTAGLLMVVVASSSAGALRFLVLGASEYPTWILLPMLLPRLLVLHTLKARASGASMLAISALTRLNQLPALMAVFAAFVWRIHRRPLHVVVSTGVLTALLLLLPAHNLYYGGRVVALPTSAGITENYVLPPDRIVAALSDDRARAALREQLRHVLARQTMEGDWLVRRALQGLQLLWIGTLAWAITLRRLTFWSALVATTPAVYLGTHIVYQVHVYYPRHILAGHFMLGASAAILVFAGTQRPFAASRVSIEAPTDLDGVQKGPTDQ